VKLFVRDVHIDDDDNSPYGAERLTDA